MFPHVVKFGNKFGGNISIRDIAKTLKDKVNFQQESGIPDKVRP